MWNRKKNRRRDLRAAYRAAEQIKTAETPREADLLTGYAVGIIDEKFRAGKLTAATADAIAEMVEAVGDGIRRELIAIRKGEEPEPDDNTVLRFKDFTDAAEDIEEQKNPGVRRGAITPGFKESNHIYYNERRRSCQRHTEEKGKKRG